MVNTTNAINLRENSEYKKNVLDILMAKISIGGGRKIFCVGDLERCLMGLRFMYLSRIPYIESVSLSRNV